VDEVVTAYAEEVAVATNDDGLYLRAAYADAGSEGQSPPVGCVESVRVDVAGGAPGAAYP